jgi:hypothetical protein
LTVAGLCLLVGNVQSQIVEPDLRYAIDLREVGKVYDQLNLYPTAVWDTIPPFDFKTLKYSTYGRIPNFLKSDFKLTRSTVEYGAVPGYRMTYTYPRVYSFELRGTTKGEFFTYEPRDVTMPGLEIQVERLSDVAEKIRVQSQNEIWRETVVTSVTSARAPGESRREGLISVDIPLPMPSQLESIFGPGDKTQINISGREEITFAGESRKVDPFIGVEGQQKQSLFPSLDMEQKLDVTLSGTIGDKVFIQVDHSSEPMFEKGNNIQLYYVGYEDDVIKRIDLGNTNLSLSGSNLLSFSTSSTGLFGVKMLAEIGPTELTVIASKQEGETSGASFSPTGGGGLGQTERRIIRDIDYIKNQYFYFNHPNPVLNGVMPIYGSDEIRPDNSDPVNKEIQVWQSVRDNEVQGTLGVKWANAFVDTMGNGQGLVNGAKNIAAGQPINSVFDRRQYRLLEPEIDYDFIVDVDNPKSVIGIELKRSIEEDRYLAVSYTSMRGDRVGGTYKDYNISDADDEFVLKLIKPANPLPTDPTGYTWHFMMRNFYNLGLSNIDPNSLDLEIRDRTQRLDTSSPIGSNVPYIRIFGLDRYDRAGNEEPDGVFDATSDVFNSLTGVIQFPSLFPFAPDTVQVRQDWTNNEFSFADSLYEGQWKKSRRLYEEYLNNPYFDASNYDIVVEAVSTSKTFRIDALNIVENSEKVTLDGSQLVRGQDYDINYDTGEVKLKGDRLNELTPNSKLNIDYEFTPFGGGASSSLVGFSTQSKFSQNARLGSIFLYESKGTAVEKPRLGEEPTRAIVGGLNGQIQVGSKMLTNIANILPLVDTDANSSITLSGEVAASVPDPNTKGEAYIEDFEGIEDSERITTSRGRWQPASLPIDPDDPQQRDKKRSSDNRGFIWYNIEPNQGGVHRRDLNPELNERENTLVPTVDIELDGTETPEAESWLGIMTGFGAGGLDLSRGQFLEIWVNDFKPDQAERGGFLRIDMGRIDENFYEPDSLRWDDEDRERDGFDACYDDTGLDGEFNAIPECVTKSSLVRDEEGGGSADIDVNGDDYVPQRINGRFSKINGTEKNFIHDSEDLDYSGQMETFNSYFSYVIDLSDTAVVDIRESFPTYDGFNDPLHSRDSWRLYRVKLSDATIVAPDGVDPQLTQVRHVRVWVDDIGTVFQDYADPGRRRIQIAELKVLGNRWEIDGVRDLSDELIPEDSTVTTEFNIGAISTKTDPARYKPPIVPREENGVFEKEQSMFIKFENFQAQTSIRIFKQFVGKGLDLTSYRDLNFWVYADPSLYDKELEYYLRLAFDEENFYEIKYPINETYFDAGSGWSYVLIRLEDLTSLKIAQTDSLFEVDGKIRDVVEKDRAYDARVVNRPNLFDVRFIYAGLRNVGPPGNDPSGEIWLNDIYAGDVRRDIGFAERVSANVNIAGGVLSVGGNWQRTDGNFRGLRERRGSGITAESFSMNAKTRVEHFVPLLGFSVPLSANYSRSTSTPRYMPNGDTELTKEEQRDSLRTERVTRSFSTSLGKKGSQNPLLKYTIDKMTTNFAFSEQMNRSPTMRDTTRSMNGSLSYQINWTKPRDISLLRGAKFRYWLNALNFRLQASRKTATRYRFRNGQFVRDPYFYDAEVRMNGSTNYSPFRSLTSSFSGSMTRDLNRPYYYNGIDIGREVGRSHKTQFSWKPPPLFLIGAFSPDISLSTNYTESSGPKVQRPGDPAGIRNVSNQRNAGAKMRFDIGKYFGKLFGKFGWLEDDKKSPGTAQRPPMRPPGGAADTTAVPPGGQRPAEEDTTSSRPRADPMIAIRKGGQILKDIRRVNINVQQRFNSIYSRIPARPSYLYQFGLTESAGIITADGPIDKPDRSNTSLTISCDTGVQLTQSIDIAARYTTTMTNSATQGSESESQSTTWPDISVKWVGLEKIGLFRSIFTNSTANLMYKKQSQESGRKGLVDQHKESLAISPSMTFTFKNEINSTLSMSYNKSTSDSRGSVTETGNMTIALDLKKDFRGGAGFKLPIPFLSREVKWKSTLNTNMNISYNRAGGKRYQAGSELFQPIPLTTSLRISPSMTYNFSRALNGRFFVEYGRSYAEATDQTVTTLRIGISAVLTF